ncbi:PLP-dependent aminotransferase family protein [Albimonas sp. CAU 1670]|uniref:MocR-like pyridoxine biosynthesis transcription factor PdxR n=1 Tax=Albimonas sp. CAU 1670 TaxID=3032599 RepID=UPI0023DB8378|nr:PLP-dependent aminotransferase family protein [Albimonas sp. CAU 1670]MDF2233686.1 PLP-dependent aminotransferase family protein [Albimonas sp. CAU 1670]
MRDMLIHVERAEGVSLQAQIRERLVSAILAGQFPPGAAMPSTRAMAQRLGVSRNTVMLAYQAMADDGWLAARERSGFYVSDTPPEAAAPQAPAPEPEGRAPDWAARFRVAPSAQRNIVKPADWRKYPYPFLYGQLDSDLFPLAAWRDCMRQSMARKSFDAWSDDRFAEDDPMLVEQIRQRLLPRRGITAKPEEVLVTLGAQNALFLIAQLLVGPDTPAAIENPGYADARNILGLGTDRVLPIPVDAEGLDVARLPAEAALAFVTPSHQSPTSVTMSMARRHALLDWADAHDGLIVEDDYEFEFNYRGQPTPALKSMDRAGRVIYVGSLSKSLMPGLRMGFIVGPAAFVAEARALRRLMLRHPPGNNQRAVALFLALGAHDALIGRLHRNFAGRWEAMHAALDAHLPGWAQGAVFGGTCFWVRGPEGMDAAALAAEARAEGVLIEPGDVLFAEPGPGGEPRPRNYFRMAFSSIAEDRIAEGVARLATAARRLGAL